LNQNHQIEIDFFREIWMSAEIDVDGNWTVDYQTINSNNFVDMRITGKWMDTIGDLGNGTG
jgi:hypothetical protein